MASSNTQPNIQPKFVEKFLKGVGRGLRPKRASTSRETKSNAASSERNDLVTGTNGGQAKNSQWDGRFSPLKSSSSATEDSHSRENDASTQYPNQDDNHLHPERGAAGDRVTENDAMSGSPDPNVAQRVLGDHSSRGSRNLEPGYDLGNDIINVMKKHKVGLKETGETNFLPDEERERMVDAITIRKTLGQISDDLVQWIEKKASKTFVITLLAISEPGKRLEAMNAFFFHGFKDGYLPVKDLPDICQYDWTSPNRTACVGQCDRDGLRQCRAIHKRSLDCFHHSAWSANAFQTFYEKQWCLLLQTFDAEIFEYPNIEDKRILPFLPSPNAGDKKVGCFAMVKPARMLQRFQNTIGNPSQTTIDIAIKTLQEVADKDYDIKKEWKNEVTAHKQLGELDKKHLVQAIAAYQHRNQYCLLFEWADGDNLRSYWETKPHSGLTSNMISEYLHQLHGLTCALDMMHRTRQARSRHASQREGDSSAASFTSLGSSRHRDLSPLPDVADLSDNTEDENLSVDDLSEEAHSSPIYTQSFSAPPEVKIENVEGEAVWLPPPNTRRDENWRHGDIKPDNILRFKTDSSDLGILKLADLGRAKQHLTVTRNRPEREFDKWRTKPYEPPDLYINNSEKSMSRLFDVWSLGCVFFESIVWMLDGKQWLENFVKTTRSANEDETPFWTRSEDSANISPIVEACMKQILDEDPECSGQRPSALRDLLNLVRNKMLVVDLPERTDEYTDGKRANTENILDDLNNIIKNSEDPGYLFTGNERSSVRPLPDPKPVVPSTLPEKHSSKDALLAPGAYDRGRSTTQRLNTYSGVPEDKWKYQDDTSFAQQVYESNIDAYNTECLKLQGQVLCRFCQRLNFQKSGLLLSRNKQDLESTCSFCAMLLTRARAGPLSEAAQISLVRNEAGLIVNGVVDMLGSSPRLRLCRSLEHSQTPNQLVSSMPLGIPRLPELAGDVSFVLCRSWLDDCDKGHGKERLSCMSLRSQNFCPKRLLDVGSSVGGDHSRIVETKVLRERMTGGVKYLALSHPWGTKTHENPHFVSTIDNIVQHMVEILDHDLPRNFQDAVVVTRQLHIRYLWIDALCILQSTSTHPGEFQDEAALMEDIFSSAYCVLAASSATGMNSGFLHSGDQIPRRKRQAAEINFGESSDHVFVCDSPDDFQRDVIDGPLSARAWALQERALARRTIFFTNNQIYWECSLGVRCESMSRLANSEAAFLGDSSFPAYVVNRKTKGAQIYLFESLYKHFCRLRFSYDTDKPFAISGLEQRLTQQFADTSGAGVFGKHLGRCLLWIRADEVERLQRIDFQTANPGTHKPPSWSFMAHVGRIAYINVPGRSVSWEPLNLRLTGTAEISWLYAKEPLKFHASARDFEVSLQLGCNSWLIAYDDPAPARDNDKCVVIGSAGDTYHYILVVRPIPNTRANGVPYERVGAGYIPIEWVRSESIDVEIF